MSKKPVLAQALASGDVLQAETVRLSVRESSRLAIDFLVRELRMAGARPVRGGACEGFERLVVADEQTVSMQYDFRGDRFGSRFRLEYGTFHLC